MNLEDQLRELGLPYLAKLLATECELTILTKRRGAYALFIPRAALSVEGNRLALGHPMGSKTYFTREEILAIKSGVSINPHHHGCTYQRVIAEQN